MRIQHNIMAMNAYRNYTNNVSAMKGNLEKLSSGYKINRAGDDAAGLAISEKMRAQITGLKQAQNNAKSAINLVQTAEGALQEVQDMLNRMVKLAEQSANGTYDDSVDRNQLQKEFTKLTEEIDRINQSANFNGKTLFGGSAASDANTKVPGAALDETNAAALVEDNTKFAFDAKATDEQKAAFNKALGEKGVEISVEVKDVNGDNTKIEDTDTVTVTGLDKLKDYTFKAVGADGKEFAMPDDGKLTFAADGTANKVKTGDDVTINVYDKEGKTKIGTLTLGMPDDGDAADGTSKVTLTAGADSKTKAADDTAAAKGPTFTENKTGGSDKTLADVDLASIDLSAAKTITKDTKEADLDVKVSFNATSKTISIEVGGKTYEGTVTGDGTSAEEITLKVASDTKGEYGEIKVKTVASPTNLKVGGSDIAAATVGKAAPAKDDTASGGAGAFSFQVGDTNATYNKIQLTIKSIASTAITDISEGTGLTLSQLKVDSEDNAGTALSALKGMVNYISDIRGDLGATQNRLTHTINNLSVMEENIQDAESTIRDTDVADEMMAYTKNNILIQSAQAMLAQANQVPQGVLQLLQ